MNFFERGCSFLSFSMNDFASSIVSKLTSYVALLNLYVLIPVVENLFFVVMFCRLPCFGRAELFIICSLPTAQCWQGVYFLSLQVYRYNLPSGCQSYSCRMACKSDFARLVWLFFGLPSRNIYVLFVVTKIIHGIAFCKHLSNYFLCFKVI